MKDEKRKLLSPSRYYSSRSFAREKRRKKKCLLHFIENFTIAGGHFVEKKSFHYLKDIEYLDMLFFIDKQFKDNQGWNMLQTMSMYLIYDHIPQKSFHSKLFSFFFGTQLLFPS